MSSSLDDPHIEKKFQTATNSQDSIQALSLWVLHHKVHHQKIVAAWMKVLQKAKISHRLTLFYLANDVVQNSKRKGILLFVNSFAQVLKEATLLVRDDHIRPSIQRVFKIWEERSVYSTEFVADLHAILANSKVPASAPSKLLADFKPEMVVKKVRSVLKLQKDSTIKSSSINLTKLNATDAEITQQLKDRTHGQQFKKDFDDGIRNLEELVETLSKEITNRNELILLLEQSEIYYDTQRGEAKVVANAYKNFDVRVKGLQRKLGELISTFPSPVASPAQDDAPSPTSDHELELNLPAENIPAKELENLENAPSPMGSPEGLNLSPAHKDVETNSQSPTLKNLGKPIPTLSNFFEHEETGMTSWISAFSSKKESKTASAANSEPKESDSSSLDSRLSNLLHNIPNLPSGLPSSLFSNTLSETSTNNKAASPVSSKKEKSLETVSTTGALTPIKDEYSGQNTPLQDEDTHSSNSFFLKLASSNKTHNPKEILKGLTNLIQSAAAEKEDAQRKKDFSPFASTELYEQPSGMSSFINNIIPSISSQSSSPSAYFSTSQSLFSSPGRTLTSSLTTTSNSYQTVSFDSMPTYSSQPTKGEENLSFIPTLVPSTSLDNFNFSHENFSEEYNPEMELFDTDMDLESPTEGDVPSPEVEPLSPQHSSPVDNEKPAGSIPGRRLSTLITVPTEGSPGSIPPSDEMYKSDKENVTQGVPPWIDNQMALDGNADAMFLQESLKASPTEEYFIGKPELNIPSYFTEPPPNMAPPNGENIGFMQPGPIVTDHSLSMIETVQSHREDLNGRWFGNNWTENNQHNVMPEIPQSMTYPPPEPQFFDNRNFHRPNFEPRHNWSPRERPDISFYQKGNHSFHPRPYGPPQNKRFQSRGRGWGRHQPQY